MTVRLATLNDFSLESFRCTAWNNEDVVLDEKALATMAASRNHFMSLIADPEIVVYGVTSGYGQNARKRYNAIERSAQARLPPISQGAAWGNPLPERVVRGIIFARLANFVSGYSAVSPNIAVAVAAMLDGRPVPVVPSRGQGGAGEILSLSHVFGPLVRGQMTAEKDVLSLINGSPAATALVADTALAATQRLDLTLRVFALTAEAFNIPLSHFSRELGILWNNADDQWALAGLNAAIGEGHGGQRRPYQAPVSFRIIPRMLGQARRAERQAHEIAAESLGAITDNPVFLPEDADHQHGQMISTGGYHNPHAVVAMDAVTAANINLVTMAGRLASKLLDGSVSLLPDQLGLSGHPGYMGCLPMAITGFEEEARMCAVATLLPGSEAGGFNSDDVASPVFLAWTKQERVGVLLEAALASLSLVAARAYQVTGRAVPPALQPLFQTILEFLPDPDAGQVLGPPSSQLEAVFRAQIYGAR